jgi:excisionase family DNA binding protein
MQIQISTMSGITFEELPGVAANILERLEAIEKLLRSQSREPRDESDTWFAINELCDYLPDKPAKPTVYGWVHAGAIPYHKGEKKLRFLKSEIDGWLKQGRRKTTTEIALEAEQYIKRRALK